MKTKISSIIFLFIGIFFISGCSSSNKTMTMEEFKSITQKNEYVFSNVSDQFKEDEKIKEVGLASTTVWHVEYYILDNEENAEDMFESNRIIFQEEKISTSSEIYQKKKKYRMYQLITANEFMYLKQVQNTVIYARVPVENRSKVLKFVALLEK